MKITFRAPSPKICASLVCVAKSYLGFDGCAADEGVIPARIDDQVTQYAPRAKGGPMTGNHPQCAEYGQRVVFGRRYLDKSFRHVNKMGRFSLLGEK